MYCGALKLFLSLSIEECKILSSRARWFLFLKMRVYMCTAFPGKPRCMCKRINWRHVLSERKGEKSYFCRNPKYEYCDISLSTFPKNVISWALTLSLSLSLYAKRKRQKKNVRRRRKNDEFVVHRAAAARDDDNLGETSRRRRKQEENAEEKGGQDEDRFHRTRRF